MKTSLLYTDNYGLIKLDWQKKDSWVPGYDGYSTQKNKSTLKVYQGHALLWRLWMTSTTVACISLILCHVGFHFSTTDSFLPTQRQTRSQLTKPSSSLPSHRSFWKELTSQVVLHTCVTFHLLWGWRGCWSVHMRWGYPDGPLIKTRWWQLKKRMRKMKGCMYYTEKSPGWWHAINKWRLWESRWDLLSVLKYFIP